MTRGDQPPVAAAELRTPSKRPRRPWGDSRLAHRYRRARRWATATLYARRHNARLPADALTLNFYPLRPHPKTQMVRMLAVLGVRIGFDPRGDGLVMAWDGGTWFDARAAARLPAGALNGRCLDVSKTTVARVWGEVAGHELAVDPLTHRGPIVVKSERNGFHDGRLVDGPLPSRQPGLAYERFIDSSRDGVVICVRTPIIGGRIPVTMVKWRPVPRWFKGTGLQEPRPTDEVFAAAEIELLLRFADRLGMDYGELDVIRDRDSGLIYAVDANRAPVRNPWLDPRHDAAIYPPMAEALALLLGERAGGTPDRPASGA